jgi:hypothetical protein
MAKTYKIWLELEEIDEDEDHYQNLDSVMLIEFDNEKDARDAFSDWTD